MNISIKALLTTTFFTLVLTTTTSNAANIANDMTDYKTPESTDAFNSEKINPTGSSSETILRMSHVDI